MKPPLEYGSPWPSFFCLLVLLCVTGCTVILFNRGPVTIQETDSHNAGTNSHTFDVNLSPR